MRSLVEAIEEAMAGPIRSNSKRKEVKGEGKMDDDDEDEERGYERRDLRTTAPQYQAGRGPVWICEPLERSRIATVARLPAPRAGEVYFGSAWGATPLELTCDAAKWRHLRAWQHLRARSCSDLRGRHSAGPHATPLDPQGRSNVATIASTAASRGDEVSYGSAYSRGVDLRNDR